MPELPTLGYDDTTVLFVVCRLILGVMPVITRGRIRPAVASDMEYKTGRSLSLHHAQPRIQIGKATTTVG